MLIDNLKKLNNTELLSLLKELSQTSVPEDALLRKVIKGTEVDTTAPMLAFVAVQSQLSFVLGERLDDIQKKLDKTLMSAVNMRRSINEAMGKFTSEI